MSRAVSKGDGKGEAARGTTGTGEREASRKPEPKVPLTEPLREKRKKRAPRPRKRRSTTAITYEIIDHTRKILKLREESPSAYQRAMAAAEVEEAELAQPHTVDLESFFDEWVRDGDYVGHMIDHDAAVEALLKELVELQHILVRADGHPIFKGKVVELGIGPGKPIQFLSELLGPEEFASLSIVANDISREMIKEAKTNLAELPNVSYTRQDIRKKLTCATSSDLIIMSQQLVFIADPEWLAKENAQPDSSEKPSEHIGEKRRVITNLFDKLNENGHFCLFEEWEVKFTESTRDPGNLKKDFLSVFRPVINRSTIYDQIMRYVPGARFVTEMKVRIDKSHSMYVMAYRKDPDKLRNRGIYLPATEETATIHNVDLAEATKAREEAVDLILEMINSTDKHFVEHYGPLNGEKNLWTDFVPIGKGPVYDSKDGVPMEGPYDTVILSRQLHHTPKKDRPKLIADAVSSLRDGGALVVIEEWNPPETAEEPIEKRDFRNYLLAPHRDRLVFQASFRVPIMEGFDSGIYAYVYRKKF